MQCNSQTQSATTRRLSVSRIFFLSSLHDFVHLSSLSLLPSHSTPRSSNSNRAQLGSRSDIFGPVSPPTLSSPPQTSPFPPQLLFCPNPNGQNERRSEQPLRNAPMNASSPPLYIYEYDRQLSATVCCTIWGRCGFVHANRSNSPK